MLLGAAFKVPLYAARAAGLSAPAFLDTLDSVAGLAIFAGVACFVYWAFLAAKRQLLWRVRRKLILSYVLTGLVPAFLIVAFFLLGGRLLFLNVSSYMVQAEVRSLGEQARFLATRAALEIQGRGGREAATILDRNERSALATFPGASMAVVPVSRQCGSGASSESGAALMPIASGRPLTAGPWAHLEPPRLLPAWVGCDGVAGLVAYTHVLHAGDDTHMVVRAAALPDLSRPDYAVVVDLPVNRALADRLRQNTGVDMLSVNAVSVAGRGARPLAGKPADEAHLTDPTNGAAADGLRNWVTFLDYRDWTTGESGTLVVTTELSLRNIYGRLSAAQGLVGDRPFGQALLLVLLVVVGGLFLVIGVVALVVSFTLARSITGSVHELFAGTERVRQGDFAHKIAITAEDQLGELAGSFNSMTASIEDLLSQAAEKKRLEEELRIAHEIQMSLLPQGPLSMPGVSVAALCIPAREVGGDYYDVLPLDDHRVGVLIADVAGKGTSAALYMAELKGLMLSLSRIHTSPRALLISANQIIAAHLDARSFITMTYAILDLRARTMTYARAGHTPLMYVPGPGAPRESQSLVSNGMVVGLTLDNGEMFERLLEEQTIPLRVGDLYLFYTDGISEAMNAADDCFGEGRLGQLLEDHADLPSDELRERVLREIEAFVGDAPQHDDMTMLLLKIAEFPRVEAVAAGVDVVGVA